MTGTNDTAGRRSRRGILASAFVAGAAAVAAKAAGGSRGEAANGDTVKVGNGHFGTKLTEIGGNYGGPVFEVYNLRSGRGSAALMGIVAEGFPVDPAPPGGSAVFGLHGGSNGHGVWGQASGIFATGVAGYATNTGSTGVYAYAEKGDAIYAESKATNSYALEGHGVFGGVFADATRDFGAAIHGVAKGNNGFGVRGQADSGVGVEGKGETGVEGSGLRGVEGRGTDIGVLGSGGPTGVFGVASDDEGIGLHGSGQRMGAFATSTEGDMSGPGAWGNAALEVDLASASGAHAGLLGTAPGTGVAGVGGGTDLALVKGESGKTGVLGVGLGAGARGVHGTTNQGSGIGVLGESGGPRGVGVQGTADPAGIGVLAQGTAKSTALLVRGIARFTQAGLGEFKAGERRKLISGLQATGRSGILVTLNGAAGAAVLQFARLNPRTKKALIQLTAPAGKDVTFTYFVVDSPAP